jgi:hypothetical protein
MLLPDERIGRNGKKIVPIFRRQRAKLDKFAAEIGLKIEEHSFLRPPLLFVQLSCGLSHRRSRRNAPRGCAEGETPHVKVHAEASPVWTNVSIAAPHQESAGKSYDRTRLGTRKTNRNTMIKSILGVICAAALLITASAHGQPTSSSPDPKAGAEMTGTIKEYTPGSLLVLQTLAPSEPIQFKLGKNVTYADTDGKTIEAPGLTTNQKIRVHYTKIGGDNVADKVTLIGD